MRSSQPAARPSLWGWLTSLFRGEPDLPRGDSFDQQEARALADFSRHFDISFHDPGLLRLALTHRSYLSVTGMGPRESNERLEFLGDSVLGLVTSEYLYRQSPDEHEGQLTKTKSLLVSKAILSRRALAMGLGRFVLMSHSEVESGGRQRLSILADAFESVLGAIYLDQGFEAARDFVERWLLRGSREIVADKRHRNYKSHLQEYVQSTFRTHPVYRIRSQMGPDHSKLFQVEVMVGRRVLGEGRGTNKKEAEQAAARDALEQVEGPGRRSGEVMERSTRDDRERRRAREPREDREQRGAREPREDREQRGAREPREDREQRGAREPREDREQRGAREPREDREQRPGREPRPADSPRVPVSPRDPEPHRTATPEGIPPEGERESRRSRRGGRGRRGRDRDDVAPPARAGAPGTPPLSGPLAARVQPPAEMEPRPNAYDEDDLEEIGRPEGPIAEREGDPFGIEASIEPGPVTAEPWAESDAGVGWEDEPEAVDASPSAEPSPDEGEPSAWPELEPEEPGEQQPEAPEDTSPPGPSFGRRRSRRR
jgi:ribonuclease-3